MTITPSNPENDRAAAIEQMWEWFDDPCRIVNPDRCPMCTARLPRHQPGCPTLPASDAVLDEAHYRVDEFGDEMDDWLRSFGADVAEEFWDAVIRLATPKLHEAAYMSGKLRDYLRLFDQPATS